jgi:sugar phosphate isomerase/epimerase
MIPALVPASLQVAGHRTVGASTGYMSDSYGNWPALLERVMATSTLAVELSALSEPELPSLVDFLTAANALPFLFVSVHAPTRDRKLAEPDLVATLARLAERADAIVVHPDTLADPSAYRVLGSSLVVENMDRRKAFGLTAEHLDRVFDALPEAGLCFDVPHADSVDPTLGVAREILDRHGARLRHVHLSSLDADCHHQPLTDDDEQRFAELLDRCRDVPWILEAPAAGR